MRHPAWFLAYHGCDAKIGEAVLAGKAELLPSSNEFDWLGPGAYFFENSYSRALGWAQYVHDHPGNFKAKVAVPFVLGAIIDPGNCLDMSDDASLMIVQDAYRYLKELMALVDLPLPKNKQGYKGDADFVNRQLDCATVRALHNLRLEQRQPEFETVRGVFTEGGELFPGSRFHKKTHVQWCVRKPEKNVIAYFRPREGIQ